MDNYRCIEIIEPDGDITPLGHDFSGHTDI